MESLLWFVTRTWFLWWIVALIAILRWFHAIESKLAEKPEAELSSDLLRLPESGK